MLFNSIDFAIFLPIVLLIYWSVSGHHTKWQNVILVMASYVFYGWWNWKFLGLIFLSTYIDYWVGYKLDQEENPGSRKWLLSISILANLGMLGFFKYYNFFVENFVEAFSFFGKDIHPYTLNIILPVGISFYTFQTLSYTIDIYRKKLSATRDYISFAAFVSFFPQLVAGPIERASNLLPQFFKKRHFEYQKATDGLRQILWGLFKKVVIADNCGIYADMFFNDSGSYGGSALLLGAIFFAFQIYGDFSGYSDIAIGVARLFGFDLMKNFAYPYFSRDIAEFWRRWHISLSSWFRDYVYIPLGGSRVSIGKQIRNVFIIFVVSGFWHGANWTFVIWGALNALFFIPLLLSEKNRKHIKVVASDSTWPGIVELIQILATFSLTTLAWIFFRADNLKAAMLYIMRIFSKSIFSFPDFEGRSQAIITIIMVLFLIIIEWTARKSEYGLEKFGLSWTKKSRWSFYAFIVFLIGMYMQTNNAAFIYFQF